MEHTFTATRTIEIPVIETEDGILEMEVITSTAGDYPSSIQYKYKDKFIEIAPVFNGGTEDWHGEDQDGWEYPCETGFVPIIDAWCESIGLKICAYRYDLNPKMKKTEYGRVKFVPRKNIGTKKTTRKTSKR